MQSKAASVDEYLEQLPPERQEAMNAIRNEIQKNIPKGFKEVMSYGMIGYVVPHELYPPGYHCDPKLPLGLMGFASQKNYIAVYHMGIYGDKNLFNWFVDEYTKTTGGKPDMGKSCIRFKKTGNIPYQLIGELAGKMTVADWVGRYED